MNILFKVLLTINATSWMVILYVINEEYTIFKLPYWLFGVLLFLIPILLSLISIWLSKFLGKDDLQKCTEFGLADNEFLPVYLGYFFISISIPNTKMMVVIYGIVFVFTFLSQTQYFNPIFLLFGYHYYHILTPTGTRIFVIHKGKVIRNKESLEFRNLRRINDTTYIEKE